MTVSVNPKSAIRETIERIYRTQTGITAQGVRRPLDSAIDPREGQFLFDLIAQDDAVLRTLEVGCAFGLSSLHICDALNGRAGAAHTIIEPFPEQWDNLGAIHLEQAGVSFHRMIHDRSEFVLPQLLREQERASAAPFDLVFIDGFHTLDHTLMDCYYANRLLRVGGYLVVDDLWMPSVRKVVNYLMTYPCFELCGAVNDPPRPVSPGRQARRRLRAALRRALGLAPPTPVYKFEYERLRPTMVALKKIAEDQRPWDWYDARFD